MTQSTKAPVTDWQREAAEKIGAHIMEETGHILPPTIRWDDEESLTAFTAIIAACAPTGETSRSTLQGFAAALLDKLQSEIGATIDKTLRDTITEITRAATPASSEAIADKDVAEIEAKWRDVPTWERYGPIGSGGLHQVRFQQGEDRVGRPNYQDLLPNEQNANLVVAARSDIRKLLDDRRAMAAELAEAKGDVEQVRYRDRLWNEAFGTTQLTHAKARLEAAESHAQRLILELQEKQNEHNAALIEHINTIHELEATLTEQGKRVGDAKNPTHGFCHTPCWTCGEYRVGYCKHCRKVHCQACHIPSPPIEKDKSLSK